MQGLADGYFDLPYTIGNYLASVPPVPTSTDDPAFEEAVNGVKEQTAKLLKNTKSGNGGQTVDHYHKELGKIMWDYCGMARDKQGLELALQKIPEIRAEFWEKVVVPGSGQELNQSLERAGRVADFLEFGELMVRDALNREESCGGHFREESQTEENEAKRDDANFSYVAVWEYKGPGTAPELHKEPLTFEYVTPSQRSYK
jgi:succinate dehydrogenase / fumarate reductase flavoprotein subunit